MSSHIQADCRIVWSELQQELRCRPRNVLVWCSSPGCLERATEVYWERNGAAIECLYLPEGWDLRGDQPRCPDHPFEESA